MANGSQPMLRSRAAGTAGVEMSEEGAAWPILGLISVKQNKKVRCSIVLGGKEYFPVEMC